jgi:hypothetical protein
VKQIPTDGVSGGLLEISTNICSRKLLVAAKVSESIQPGNAEIGRKGAKCANVKIYCAWCLFTRVSVSRYVIQH